MEHLSVIIVTFNSASLIGPALDALFAHGMEDMEVCVIDNHSSDTTSDIVEKYPSVKFIQNKTNTGFSAACNQGVHLTSGDRTLFMNPDLVIEKGTLPLLAKVLDEAPESVAGAGPKLVQSKTGPIGEAILDSTGMVLSRKDLSPHDRGQDEIDTGQYDTQTKTFGPSCACALFRRNALENLAVNGEIFDEDFFAYYEDVDLAWRAHLFGYSFIYVPEAKAIHDRKNPAAHSPEIEAIAFVNRYFCVLKNEVSFARYFPGTILVEVARLCWKTLSRAAFLTAWSRLVKLYPVMKKKRQEIQNRRVAQASTLEAIE